MESSKLKIFTNQSSGKVFPEPVGVIPGLKRGQSYGDNAVHRTIPTEHMEKWISQLTQQGCVVSVVEEVKEEVVEEVKEEVKEKMKKKKKGGNS